MKAKIKIVNASDIMFDEDNAPEQVVVITFDPTKVNSYYKIVEGDQSYLYTNISGIEYPLIYDEYLEIVFEDLLTEKE